MTSGLWALVLYSIATGTLLALIAARFGERDDDQSPLSVTIGLQAIAVFNPWTYTEVVAGHLYAILAVAGFGLVWIEARSSRPSNVRTILGVLAQLQQVQFLLLSLAIVAWLAIVRRRIAPLAISLLVLSPCLIGIATDVTPLAATPLTLDWEREQSISPSTAWLLDGYFMDYTTHAQLIMRSGLALLCIVCGTTLLVCAYRRRRRQVQRWIPEAVLATCAFTVVTGLKGPLGPAMTYAFRHFAPLGAYRELYTLLYLVLFSYFAIASAVRFIPMRVAILAAANVCLAAWFVAPPDRWWVSSTNLPFVVVNGNGPARFALLPAFQPLSSMAYGGSGRDPDDYLRREWITPLNVFLPGYPEVAALAKLERGDASWIRGLGVSTVINRSWLRESSSATAARRAGFVDAPTPRVSLLSTPQLNDAPTPGDATILTADAAGRVGPGEPAYWGSLPSVAVVPPPRSGVAASKGWVDARLAFQSHPDLAQAYGGAWTETSDWLSIPRSTRRIFAYVDGRLYADGKRRLAVRIRRYSWIAVAAGTSQLRCYGTCVIAALSKSPAWSTPKGSSTMTAGAAVPWRELAPWLYRIDLPESSQPIVVRLDVAYSDAWKMWSGDSRRAAHVRLEGAVNGFFVAPGKASAVVVIHWVSALQEALEGLSTVTLLVLGLLQVRRQYSQRKRFKRGRGAAV